MPRNQQSSLSILSYNVWGLKVGRFAIAENIQRRMVRIVAAIRALDPDVIALQEVWCPRLANYFTKRLNYPYHYQEPMRGFFKGHIGNGLLILSKYPILEKRILTYTPYTEWYEYFAAKGALSVVIRTPAGDVRFVNTHLGSGRETRHVHARRIQLCELETFLEALSLREPVVLAGDLNFTPDSAEYLNLLRWARDRYAELQSDAFAEGHPGSAGPTYFASRSFQEKASLKDRADVEERIDYIFAFAAKESRVNSRVVRSEVVFDNPFDPLSDHNGVWAELDLTPKQTIGDILDRSWVVNAEKQTRQENKKAAV